MELLIGILIIAMLVAWASIHNLKARVDRLEHIMVAQPHAPPVPVAAPESEVAPEPPAMAEAPPPAAAEAPEEVPAMAAAVATEPAAETTIVFGPEEEEQRESESVGALLERLIGGQLLIWLGGIALVVAAIFLIRYSIEIGLMTPATRMIGAAAFGLLLLGLGEYARVGKLFADDPRIAQVLVGAGIAVLYATAYGSYILYALIDTRTASVAMLGVTVLALGLSLRHGAPTAVMGLVGGFLTPVLVGDPSSSAVPLLAYLGLLDLAIFLIAWRRGWTWLATAAVGFSFLWSTYLLSQPRDHALASGVFIVVLALAASTVRPGGGRSLSLIQPLLIGIVQLTLLVARSDLDLPAWTLFAALAAASMILAALRSEHRIGPPVALGFALLLLFAKSATELSPYVPEAAIGTTLLFGLGGLAIAFWRPAVLWTLVAAAGLAGPALILRGTRPELLPMPGWGGVFALLAAAAAVLVWRDRARASATSADDSLAAASATAALLACAAIWNLLPHELAPTGWLAVAIAIGLAARRLDDLALNMVAAVTAMVAIGRGLWMVPELSTALMEAAVGDPVLAADLPTARTALFALALPAVLLAGLRFALGTLPLRARRMLLPAAGVLGAAAAYIWFKQTYGLASHDDFVARGFLERVILTQFLFVLGWLLGSGRLRLPRIEPDLALTAGTALTAVAAARLIWFDMFLHNPAVADQWVGPMPVLNLILPAYWLSAIWLYAARRRADAATRSGFWLAAFLAALIAGAMLLVRQNFHGPILTGFDMPIAEFYGYSLAALLLSIGLLLAGVRLPDKALRLAGLLLLTATILKVFLVDASELKGLLRILSFLGLGVALIGIGRMYGPVLRAERSRE